MIIKEHNIQLMFLYIILSVTISFAQGSEGADAAVKYQFKYRLTHQADSADVNSLESEEMLLLVGDDISKFQSLGAHLRDSITRNMNKENLNSLNLMNLMGSVPKTKFKEIVYKDRTKDKITYRERIFKDNFEYQDSLSLFNWEIKGDVRNINGYDCRKATTAFAGRQYEAWYAPEIPISDGPYKFNGLPGLIVKIQDADHHYLYELIELKKVPRKTIALNKEDHIVTTKSEFYRVKKEFYNNIFSKLEQSGIRLDFQDASQKKNTARALKKRNNPIERTHG
ncbi:GLPGLI family protein [Maribacter sp. 2307ULW6-5]|uniref:GLPGLI family protein n=1 Tax=Maribacter sp. 2307ULW6-5 TaxID=3386275 RepID=UPI0039BCD4C3